ncbi:MAG: formate/nitrite transporter family protein [Coprobacter fastidiosus]
MHVPFGAHISCHRRSRLFTGNNAILIPGVLNDKYKWTAVWKNWVIVYFSNFIGALFFVYVMVHSTGVVASDPWHSAIKNIAVAKVSMPWITVFLKGIRKRRLVSCRMVRNEFVKYCRDIHRIVVPGYGFCRNRI